MTDASGGQPGASFPHGEKSEIMTKERPFRGFTPETSEYLWDLAFHNERPWFNEHKETFLRVLKEPFDALGWETLDILQSRYPELPLQLHISRIYRDARRLFGRGPYKDNLWFTIWSGAERHDNPAFWFEISASSYGYGVGFWAATSAEMEIYRRFIAGHPAQMEELAVVLRDNGRFRLGGEDFKRPKGDVGELLNPWYNKKNVFISAEYDFGGDLLSPELPKILADGYTFLMPYYELFRVFGINAEEARSEE